MRLQNTSLCGATELAKTRLNGAVATDIGGIPAVRLTTGTTSGNGCATALLRTVQA